MRALALVMLILLLAAQARAKDGRTFYTEEKLARVRQKLAQHDWARRQAAATREACDWILKMPDAELWDYVPPPEQLRALNTHFGADCPVHGDEIHRKAGHYPWAMSRERPFKVKCPVGGEEYPSNDFQPWNVEGANGKPETGPGYVDKGLGWVDEKGRRYWFVDCYIFWQRWQREVIPMVGQLSQAYLLTGEPAYAHKCAVLLARIAGDYERFDYATQAYHNGGYGTPGRILDYIWETGIISSFAAAYDAVYPALEQDAELRAFLKAKGVEDPRAHIETRMLHVMARDVMRGFIKGNAGMHQASLATLAIVLANDNANKGPTTAQMRDWLMLGDGDIEYLLWNGFYRDGHGGESSPGYSSGWYETFYRVAELLPRLGVDIWSNPKVKKMADVGLDLAVAGTAAPCIGDSGSILGGGRVGWSATLQGPALRHYKDPRFAKALAILGAKSESLWDDPFDEAQVAAVKREGTDLGLKTRNLGGYGLAVLESGRGEHRRGVSLYYGHAGGGHGHFDRLTLELWAFGRPMLTDMGYPAHWLPKATYWTCNTTSHYGVLVDQAGQRTMYPGHLNTLASAPGVQLMDASAERVAYPGTTSLYRRTTALIDISPEHCYLLDLFRVQGGRQHDWSFHGPPFPDFTVAGGEPGPAQAKGTLAGEDVAFGEMPKSRVEGDGVALNLSLGEGVLKDPRPYDSRSAEAWSTYYDTAVLTRKVGAVMSASMPPRPAGKVRLFLQVYDYNAGANAIDVAVGEATHTLRWEPSGRIGYRWISQVYDLPKPADRVTLTAREYGQSYILIDGLALSRDVDLDEPRIVNASWSGFQYLTNVRRLRPQGTWSATWRKPDEDLALTMTMPAGCSQEVILADAEPELKPGHPKTLQYVLGRNAVPSRARAPEGGLASTYVAVVEPHRGPAAVTGVERLRPAGKVPAWASALAVRHGAERDLIHSCLDPGQECAWRVGSKTLRVAGEFAVVTLDGEGVRRACLVNGTRLSWGDFVLEAPPSPAGKVLSIDPQRNTVTLDAALPDPGSCGGLVAILGNERHQTSYTIQGATVAGGRTTLDFGDTLFTVGMGKVTKVDADERSVSTDTQLTGYGRVDGGQHAGRWLYNEDKTRGFRIRSVQEGKILLEGAVADEAFTDANGDGRRLFWISDIGPGDTFRIPLTTYVERGQGQR